MSAKSLKKTISTKQTSVTTSSRLRLRHWVLFWVLVAATYALVITIFSNVDVRTLLPVNVVNDEKMTAEEEVIKELKAEIVALTDRTSTIVQAYSKYPCMDEATFAAPDSYVTYRDQITGIQVQLPYNQHWGGEGCALSPFSARSATGTLQIYFGPSVPDMRGGWERIYFLAGAPTSSAAMRNEIKIKHPGQEVVTRTINGIPVYQVIYNGSYDPAYTSWYAVGRNYLFSFRVREGALSDAEAIKIIQSLRVTK